MTTAMSGCLVLGDPQYLDPERTAPRITPLTRPEELRTELSAEDGSWDVSFRVTITSEDAGETVELALLRNFGGGAAGGDRPYESEVGRSNLAPATLSDGPRPVTVDWFDPGVSGEDYDCARVTLLATHEFRGGSGPDFYCPADPTDVDTVTWFVLRCRDTEPRCTFDLCNDNEDEEANYCDPPE
ncbi:MAG: hypothetical protein AAGN82_19380 [Myxococcota bacterium]